MRLKLTRAQFWLRLGQALCLLFVFLVGIRGLGTGFQGLGADLLESFFEATSNPFVGLGIGILATSLVQSSSVTTSMVVALVAAPENPLPIQCAIPMVMGANIGTTVTATIVALGHISRRVEFRRAFAAATCHDFFNFISVAIFLPLEMATGYLSRASAAAVAFIGTGGGGRIPNPIKSSTKALVEPVQDVLVSIAGEKVGAVLLIVVSMLVIFGMLALIVKVLRELAATRMQTIVTRSLDASPYIGIVVGIVVTAMVQSSSITTSVMVPLAGAGIVTLAQVFPITLGANIGTTVTALLASMAAPPETAHLAVQIALVHLFFNLSGTVLIYPWKRTRQIPLGLATWLSVVAVRSKKTAVLLVLGLFYALPGVAIFVSKVL